MRATMAMKTWYTETCLRHSITVDRISGVSSVDRRKLFGVTYAALGILLGLKVGRNQPRDLISVWNSDYNGLRPVLLQVNIPDLCLVMAVSYLRVHSASSSTNIILCQEWGLLPFTVCEIFGSFL